MANKRGLKRQIKGICGELAAECVMAMHVIPDIDSDKMHDVIASIANLQCASLRHATFGFDKSPRDFESAHDYKSAKYVYFKKAYGALVQEFNQKVEEIVKNMNAALPSHKK